MYYSVSREDTCAITEAAYSVSNFGLLAGIALLLGSLSILTLNQRRDAGWLAIGGLAALAIGVGTRHVMSSYPVSALSSISAPSIVIQAVTEAIKLVVVGLTIAMIVLPSIVAVRRGSPIQNSVILNNLLIGWLPLGWNIVLFSAFLDGKSVLSELKWIETVPSVFARTTLAVFASFCAGTVIGYTRYSGWHDLPPEWFLPNPITEFPIPFLCVISSGSPADGAILGTATAAGLLLLRALEAIIRWLFGFKRRANAMRSYVPSVIWLFAWFVIVEYCVYEDHLVCVNQALRWARVAPPPGGSQKVAGVVSSGSIFTTTYHVELRINPEDIGPWIGASPGLSSATRTELSGGWVKYKVAPADGALSAEVTINANTGRILIYAVWS